MKRKNIKSIVFIIAFGFLYIKAISQTNKYFVALKDKNNNGYSVSNPSAFLSARSIQRRMNQGIPIDYSDLPVTPSYVNQIESVSGVTVLHRLKWLNGLIIQATNTVALSVVQSYTFVQSTQPLNYTVHRNTIDSIQIHEYLSANKTYSFNYGNSFSQIHQLNLECLHNDGYKGEGMIISVIDDGFYNVNNNPVFDSLILQGRLLGTRDFVSRDTMVFEDDYHGAYVLSTMAALSYGNIVGTAPKASYWLLRTEDINSEYPIEEYYWIRAAEFADSVGTDIITSSLGYTTFDNSSYNHTYSMLDGKTLAISKAATMAARKGIFVCIAAGNEGAGSWYYISAPSDADSVCTVGAVDASGNVASFSGKGPTSNGRIKPDVCARGVSTAIAAPNGAVFTANGTSFATPLIAGAVACLWQAKPNLTNIQLLNLIKQFSSNSSSPNNNIGWGIPNFCAAYTTINNLEVSQSVKIFPNPTSKNIYLKTYQVMNKIAVFDVLGHVLLIKNVKDVSEMIDLSDIKNGIYFITIEFENGNIFNAKIIKY